MRHFPSTLTAPQSGEMVDRLARSWGERGFGGWAVERLDSGAMAGMVMLSSPTWEAWFTPCLEVGWRFSREQWGHGFATEAARAVVDWAFANLTPPDDQVVSFTTVENLQKPAPAPWRSWASPTTPTTTSTTRCSRGGPRPATCSTGCPSPALDVHDDADVTLRSVEGCCRVARGGDRQGALPHGGSSQSERSERRTRLDHRWPRSCCCTGRT